MPRPMPHSGEKEAAFVSRFMGNKDMMTEYPDSKQRAAVAYQKYRDRRKKKQMRWHK